MMTRFIKPMMMDSMATVVIGLFIFNISSENYLNST